MWLYLLKIDKQHFRVEDDWFKFPKVPKEHSTFQNPDIGVKNFKPFSRLEVQKYFHVWCDSSNYLFVCSVNCGQRFEKILSSLPPNLKISLKNWDFDNGKKKIWRKIEILNKRKKKTKIRTHPRSLTRIFSLAAPWTAKGLRKYCHWHKIWKFR